MPTRDSYPEGTPSWVDLSTDDIEGAKKFYAGLFGWSYEESGTDEMPYSMASKNGRWAAGIGIRQDENMPESWTTYFAVDSVDQTVEKVKQAGGRVYYEPDDVMSFGRMAIVAGATGEVFGLWEARDHKGAGVVNEHGSISWNELMTDDVETALSFYEKVFGHVTRTADMGGGFMYSTLAVGDRQIAGAMGKPDENIPNSWGVYFYVDDTPKAVEYLKQNGGQIMFGPDRTEGVGVIGGGTDPQGAYFSVITPDDPPTD